MPNRGTNYCRSCSATLNTTVLSLGYQPLPNLLPDINSQELVKLNPLDFRICSVCSLGQVGEYESPQNIFTEYSYLSSTSRLWLKHAEDFANKVINYLSLKPGDLVIEVASNDGYLLQFFKEKKIDALGIEPSINVARISIGKGIPTETSFFGQVVAESLVKRGLTPKLVVCNNVLAHVPDINDFVAGLKVLIEAGAIVSIEAPSLKVLLEKNLFDTIYHEHFSYLSVVSLDFLSKKHGVNLFKIEYLETHGGSYRYWIGSNLKRRESSVDLYLEIEQKFDFNSQSVQKQFRENSLLAINNFRNWCLSQDTRPVGFGAAAKSTVLLNAAKITNNNFAAIADNSIYKMNKKIPGTDIPILSPAHVLSKFSSNLVIFAWNLVTELTIEIHEKFPMYQSEIWVAIPKLNRIK